MTEAAAQAQVLRAPFPWFGGKSRVAQLVWERFGDVPNYVEPFAGSLAVLLGRPHAPKTETVNDLDCYLANFWRAVRFDPAGVAWWADAPVNEADLQARHLWLVNDGRTIADRCKDDPDFFDPRVAGWWVWGLCSWIGSGWCSGKGPWKGSTGAGVRHKLPHLGDAGRGINRQLPHLGDAGRGESYRAMVGMLDQLSARLRRVRVACGDWTRVLGDSVTVKHGATGVLLDPPYASDQHAISYSAGGESISAGVRAWALARGDDPGLRIALCGYEGEHEALERSGWTVVAWKARGGYGSQGVNRGRDNAARERVWFSPHCIAPHRVAMDLFHSGGNTL
ncbi:MAG: class adenine-specific methyltransferase [Gemmatimonadetes bacterium]|nr:class adenine-specific methyltransferase [Gemmatimonadota bacterium]